MLDLLLAVAAAAGAAGAAAFGLHQLADRAAKRAFEQPVHQVEPRDKAIVVAYHPEVREIGMRVLENGGNAMDAFVAAVAAENVMAEGASTFAGPLGVLIYTAADERVRYLDADLNDPIDPAGGWDPKTKGGSAALVPGAPAALELIARELGTRPLSDLLQPAIELAEGGFHVNVLMAETIRRRRKVLRKSEFGRKTYLLNRQPLTAGATIRIPEVSRFLKEFGSQGASYVYNGEWGREFIAKMRTQGGLLTEEDLLNYRAVWREPFRTTYRGHQIYSNSGRSFGGLYPVIALKVLEHGDLPASPHYSQDASTLETMLRIAHQVWAEDWILDFRALDDPEVISSRLTSEYTAQIWSRVRKELGSDRLSHRNGTHSYHLIVADKQGNVVSGTTTIYSDAWGEGLFVQGIPLAPAGMLSFLSTQPGQRRLSPLSMHIVFRAGRPVLSIGTISDSLLEAAFQLLTNYLVHGLSVGDMASAPRFGTFPDERRSYLDPRTPEAVVKALEQKGFRFKRSGVVDTGLGAVVAIDQGGYAGSLLPLPYLADPFVVPPPR